MVQLTEAQKNALWSLSQSGFLTPNERSALSLVVGAQIDDGVCGTCREAILPDALTGTTCACARGAVVLPRDAYDTLVEKARRYDASSAMPHEIIDARKAMLDRQSEVHAVDRQTGGNTFYDHEIARHRTRIFKAIDAEIERINRATMQTEGA